MLRYQVKMVDTGLPELVQALSARALEVAGADARDERLRQEVFLACRDLLRGCVTAFHCCGCQQSCDGESLPTLWSKGSPVPEQIAKVGSRSLRVRRYRLTIDGRLVDFSRALSERVVAALGRRLDLSGVDGRLGHAIERLVAELLGPHVFFSPSCNRGEYLCVAGACTEYDPWDDA